MDTIDNPRSSEPHSAFNRGDLTLKEEEDEGKRSLKGKESIASMPLNRTHASGAKDKGVQYLVLSVVGYVCASIVFGFLLNKNRKQSKA